MKGGHSKPHRFAPVEKARISTNDAEILGEAMIAIEKQHGAVTQTLLVEKARPRTSAIHRFFTWDNDKAAELWRLEEARYLIRSVVVVIDEAPDSKPTMVRAFSSVEASETENSFAGRAFISTDRAVADEAYREQLVSCALKELVSWKKRYAALKQFVRVFEVISATEAELTLLDSEAAK